jgi:hypothetical protein
MILVNQGYKPRLELHVNDIFNYLNHEIYIYGSSRMHSLMYPVGDYGNAEIFI